jgi:hypothetical protein
MGCKPSRHTERKARRDESLADILSSRTAANSIRVKLEASRNESKSADALTKATATSHTKAETPRVESLAGILATRIATNSVRAKLETPGNIVWGADVSTKKASFTVPLELETPGNQHLRDVFPTKTAATWTVYAPGPFDQLPPKTTASLQSKSAAQYRSGVGAPTNPNLAKSTSMVSLPANSPFTGFAATTRDVEQVHDAIHTMRQERRRRDGEPETYEERLAWKKEWNTVWKNWVWLEKKWAEAYKAEGFKGTPAEQWWRKICARDD